MMSWVDCDYVQLLISSHLERLYIMYISGGYFGRCCTKMTMWVVEENRDAIDGCV